jgi:hypothetical protein
MEVEIMLMALLSRFGIDLAGGVDWFGADRFVTLKCPSIGCPSN